MILMELWHVCLGSPLTLLLLTTPLSFLPLILAPLLATSLISLIKLSLLHAVGAPNREPKANWSWRMASFILAKLLFLFCKQSFLVRNARFASLWSCSGLIFVPFICFLCVLSKFFLSLSGWSRLRSWGEGRRWEERVHLFNYYGLINQRLWG